MTVCKDREAGESHQVSGHIRDLVHQHVPFSEVLSDAAGEISFRLPFEASSTFPVMLKDFHTNSKKHGVER
jgi:hypothetical protein